MSNTQTSSTANPYPPEDRQPLRVAILGAGIAGLSAAITLRKLRPDCEVTIFEASDRAGGVLETITEAPYLIERSADNFATLMPDALELCKETGYESELIRPEQHGRQAFVLSRGRILPIPVGFSLVQPTRVWPILTTGTLSLPGKLRMLGEFFVKARQSDEDESLLDFATRRLGKDAFESLVEPIVSGIFTADPARLSMQATLPQFVKMEREHGGLIRGYLAAKRDSATAASRRASGARYDQFMAPRQGMSHLIHHLVRQLPPNTIQYRTAVQSVSRVDPHAANSVWSVKASTGSSEIQAAAKTFDRVIVALPTHHAARVLKESEPELASGLQSIEYASSAVVVMVVDRADIARRVDGFGLIVPAKEKRPVLAISYTSNKYPGRAPADQILMRIFFGGATHGQDLAQSDEQLLACGTQQLREILGWSGKTARWQAVVRWNQAMPQYHIGHVQHVSKLMQMVRQTGSLAICGAGYSGVGIPQTIRSARQAAESMARV